MLFCDSLCFKLTFSNIERISAPVSLLPAAARQARIRERFATQPSVSVSDLAREFQVSEMTIRRDLNALETEARIQRTHGGAIVKERMILEFDYRDRRERHQAEKRAIAREARKLVQSGQRLILDNGTTTLELAGLLKDCEELTVITPSLAVASELQHAPGVEVILLGGVVRQGSPDLTGPVTEHCLRLFSVDFAFQGADGIGGDGSIYTSDLQMAKVDMLMRGIAKHSCLLADSSKIGQTALARCGSMSDVQYFITDQNAPAAALRRFEKQGPAVVRAAL